MPSSPRPSPALRRRPRVHDAVRELMAEQGFRVSMDAVAARAGCSKQTLYSYFGSKQELMRSVMQEHLDMATAGLDDQHGDLRTTLLAFAMEHLQRLSEPHVIATCQLLSAEAALFPEEARTLYRDGCDTLQQRLAEWLALAMRRGQLRHDDPHCASELLLGMIVGLDFERQRFAVPPRDTDAARRRWAEFAVDAFLRSFTADDHALPAASTVVPLFPISKS
jgi:AcrR family transcriptional regulator